MTREGSPPRVGRREALKLLGGGLAAAAGASPACGRPAARAPTTVALASLPVGGRARVLDGENPVELLRTADDVVVGRSLWCTHFGCEVRWSEEREEYLCPCHDGVFDADGRPVSGPPLRPLGAVPVEIRGDEIVVGGAVSGPPGPAERAS